MVQRLIIGCGYLGSRVAKLWRDAGDDVHAVTRSAARAAEFAAAGWTPWVADVTHEEGWTSLPQADTVLFAVGHDRQATASIDEVYAGGVRRALEALSPATRRFLYISSTGVYGPAAGGWVDEQTPPDPRRAGGAASLAAEREVAASALADRSVILRMAGLYGPGRIPFVDKLRRGEALTSPAEGWLNLIHIDDAARISVAAADWSRDAWEVAPLVLCVSDGHPAPRRAYYQAAAQLLGAPPPQFVAPHAESPAAARAAADRRVRTTRLLQFMPSGLLYSNYREGLAAALGRASC